MRPNQGYPPHGYPPNQGYPPQGYPNQGYPPQGYPNQGYPPQGQMPPQGYPNQGYPPHGQMPPQGYPNQGYPPQQPGMMPYQNQNFQNYQMNTYGITRNHINQNAEQLFRKYDHDRSGELQMHELIPLLNEFCAVSNIGQINPRDAQYMMYLFDWDRSGAISFKELKMMLKMLGGIKKYDKIGIMNKFKNGKGKKNKDKSMKKKGLKKIIDFM